MGLARNASANAGGGEGCTSLLPEGTNEHVCPVLVVRQTVPNSPPTHNFTSGPDQNVTQSHHPRNSKRVFPNVGPHQKTLFQIAGILRRDRDLYVCLDLGWPGPQQ